MEPLRHLLEWHTRDAGSLVLAYMFGSFADHEADCLSCLYLYPTLPVDYSNFYSNLYQYALRNDLEGIMVDIYNAYSSGKILPPPFDTEGWPVQVRMTLALAEHGKLRCLAAVLAGPMQVKNTACGINREMFLTAARYDQVHIMRWLLARSGKRRLLLTHVSTRFAAWGGAVKALRWLISLGCPVDGGAERAALANNHRAAAELCHQQIILLNTSPMANIIKYGRRRVIRLYGRADFPYR